MFIYGSRLMLVEYFLSKAQSFTFCITLSKEIITEEVDHRSQSNHSICVLRFWEK